MSDPMLSLSGVKRTYRQADGGALEVLRGVDFTLHAGQMVALVGPSGAGKSTLLHMAGLLEKPDDGRVLIDGTDCSAMDDGGRTAQRRKTIGFVYQSHRLLPEFSALENVVIPQRITGMSGKDAKVRASQLLAMVGLAEREGHRPSQLSGGEQQRVAIARALANAPRLVLADEPTGNLDPKTAEGVFTLLTRLVRETGIGALVATHNFELAQRMDRRIELVDGILVER